MKKAPLAMILYYFVFYCLGLLAVPYIAGIANLVLMSPFYILFTSSDIFQLESPLLALISILVRLITFSGVFVFYYLITKESIENFGRINKLIFFLLFNFFSFELFYNLFYLRNFDTS